MKYKTKGTCSKQIDFDIIDGKVSNIKFLGGCNGNSQGISILAEGLTPLEVINKLSGIRCEYRNTSCPDQLAKALSELNL